MFLVNVILFEIMYLKYLMLFDSSFNIILPDHVKNILNFSKSIVTTTAVSKMFCFHLRKKEKNFPQKFHGELP